MEKNLGYLAVSAGIAAGIAGAAGISYCLNQRKLIKASVRASDVKEFVERRRRRAAEKRRMNQEKEVSL